MESVVDRVADECAEPAGAWLPAGPTAARFGGSGRPVVALASYPRSGNSLLRALLERATGVVTGSDTMPTRGLGRALRDAGLRAEGATHPSLVDVVKSHWPERLGWRPFAARAVVVLVRHPLDAVASYFHQSFTFSHDESVPDDVAERLPWGRMVCSEAAVWQRFHEFWLARAREAPVLFVRYEDLLRDRAGQLDRVLRFAGLAGSAAAVAGLAQEDAGVYRPRCARVGAALERYTPEQLALFGTGESLAALGYSLSPPALVDEGWVAPAPLAEGAQVHFNRAPLCRPPKNEFGRAIDKLRSALVVGASSGDEAKTGAGFGAGVWAGVRAGVGAGVGAAVEAAGTR